MTLRVKSDKEYAALLLSMTQQTEKQEAADYVSTVSKVSCLPVGGAMVVGCPGLTAGVSVSRGLR